ncbi:MAG: hypothetical protein Q7J78_00475 [Clostridiales bacterium]|nr:hypothetical protein [Clostridiales bacterium]
MQEDSAQFFIMTRAQILEKQIKDWKIKYDNLYTAKKMSQDNLNQEIDSLKNEIKLKDKQIDTLYEIIGKMDKRVDELTQQVAQLAKENAKLKETIAKQNDQIACRGTLVGGSERCTTFKKGCNKECQ